MQPEWTPEAPYEAPPTKKARKATGALIAGGVLLALLVIGGIIVATRPGSDEKISAASSSTVTSGASGGSSTTTDGQTATDFTTFDDATNDFSIGTPPSWMQVSLSDPKAQAAIDQMVAENPQLGQAFGNAATLASTGVKFLAVDPTGGANVNVIVQPAVGAPAVPTNSDLESVLPGVTTGLEATGATVTSHQIVTVNARPALQVLYDLPLKNGGVDFTVHSTAYLFVTEDTLHIVTIAGKADVVEQVISTFTVG